jgi:hypothetical protein
VDVDGPDIASTFGRADQPRQRRGVLLDLSGWDERRDARAIKTGKRDIETEQREVIDGTSHVVTDPAPAPADAIDAEAVSDE